jgi:catechol 2,3-dioxygenase-like lactoylglutathione lyase family enzyme
LRAVDIRRVGMSRVQLAMNVDNLEEAVAFYSKLFEATPHKRRPGYANFALEQPALKLVLIENRGQGGSLNHLGVEVASSAEVTAATARLADEGLATRVEDEVTCCYAVQDKVWVTDPNGAPWEIYTVLDDDPEATSEVASADGCCGGNAVPLDR